MAEVKPSTSRGEDAAELLGEVSCSGADGATYPGSVPPSFAAESPSFLTWMWIQILTACSGVWGARGGGLLGPRTSGVASGVAFWDSIQFMLQIASGMQGLHVEGVLHRDLKAANVLIYDPKDGRLFCDVADYECAMFVQGTGFWRALEVLQELQKSEEDRNGKIWTEKVDAYSFGMTCYEILTGQIPFVGYTKSKWGDVIRGERPSLPEYVVPKLRELVEACWHTQPSERPSFEVIIKELASLQFEYKAWE